MTLPFALSIDACLERVRAIAIEGGQRETWIRDELARLAPAMWSVGIADDGVVNIALIWAGLPLLGVIHAPSRRATYWGAGTALAGASIAGEPDRAIAVRVAPATPVVATGFCAVASGEADVYLSSGPTREWETAAGHAIVVAAGGTVTPTGGVLRYRGDAEPHNPACCARGAGWLEKPYPLSAGRIAGDGLRPPPIVAEIFQGMKDSTERVRDFTLPPTLEAMHGTWLNALRLIESMRGMYGGFPIDQYDHVLQAATRAYRANASDELVLAALLHDVGKTLSMSSHAEVAAAMLKPFVSPETFRILDTHTAFQGRYYFHLVGLDPDRYLAYRDEPWFDTACTFSTEWDCPAFEVGYQAKPLSDFVPLLQQFMGAKPRPLFGS